MTQSQKEQGRKIEWKNETMKHSLKGIMAYFVKGYKFKDHELYDYEFFVDTAKDTVIVMLSLKPKEKHAK